MRSIYTIYAEGLRDVTDVSVLPFSLETGEVPQWSDVLTDRCGELHEHLAAKRIHGRRYWYPLHTQKPYQMADNRFPHSTKQVPRAMWLPSALTLSDADMMMVCDEIREFLSRVPAEMHVRSVS